MAQPNMPFETNDSLADDALFVVKRLRAAGYVAYFAGGCVRDRLLGQVPKDYDVATDAPPDQVRRLFNNTQAVGAAFWVILVRRGKSVIEVATFRRDVRYRDGRHPDEVVFTTAEEDAKRRDFTINGLFYDPLEDKVIDYVGGQEDLKNKVLRAIGEPDHRFEEDHLRMLRAIRFAARMGLTIAPQTADAIKHHAQQLQRISPERVGEELRCILTPPTRDEAFVFLRQFRLLSVIMRFLPETPGSQADGNCNIFLALGAPPQRGPISFGLALAGLTLEYRMHASGIYDPLKWLAPPEIKRSVSAMRKALKISNEEADRMSGAMSFAHLLDQKAPPVATMKRFLARATSSDARLLMSALLACGLMRERIANASALLDQTDAQGKVAPEPLITGDDLLAAGLTPGPLFKRVLEAVYDAQLEDRVRIKDQALDLAMNLAQKK
jgi:tRNA nucleotidyltransferase/poly(A) polymerase